MMPSSVCHITEEGGTFMIRFYNSAKKIGIKKPLDVWDCHEVVVDEGTLDYLNDKNIVEYLRRKKMKDRIALWFAKFLLRREWFFIAVNEALSLGGMHVHKNPRKVKLTAIVNFPEAKEDGK
jgi:hypothetical protein